MEQPTGGFHYDAFISYRHVEPDRTWAKCLQRELEGLRVPQALVEQDAPSRIGRVFRDDTELAASTDLNREIELALEQSRYLIVVCSPAAVESKWIRKEIDRFRELGRETKILSLLVEGGWPEAAPAVLREVDGGNPFYIDVTLAKKPGRGALARKAVVSFAAPILGVRPSDLSEWRAKADARLVRTRRWVAASAVAVLLVATVMAWLQWSRAEGEQSEGARARDNAEELVSVILASIRDQIDEFGPLGAHERMALGVIEHYKQLPREHVTAEIERTRVEALSVLAEILTRQGDAGAAQDAVETALEAFQKSLGFAEQALAAQPDDPVARHAVERALERIGDLQWFLRADRTAALKAYEAAVVIERARVERDPDDATSQRDLSVGLGRVGAALLALGDVDRALAAYREGEGIAQWLVTREPESPGLQRDLSVSHEEVGGALAAKGDLTGALVEYRKSLEIRKWLLATSRKPTQARRDLLVSHERIGSILLDLEQHAEALAAYTEVLEIAKRLAAEAPADLQRADDLARAHSHVGRALTLLGQHADALVHLHAGREIHARTFERDRLWGERNVAIADARIADLERRAGHLEAAEQAAFSALTVLRRLAAGADVPGPTQDVAIALRRLGNIRRDQGRLKEALADYQESVDIVLPFAIPGTPVELTGGMIFGRFKAGDTSMALDDFEGALRSFEAALEDAKAAVGMSNEPLWKRVLASAHSNCASALEALDRDAEAAQHRKAAEDG